SRAFLATKTERAIEQPWHEPFEAHWDFTKRAPQPAHHTINHAATNQGLTDRDVNWPVRPMGQQISYGHSQVVIWIHQPGGRRNDAMPVGVWIVGESDIILVLEIHQTRHRIRTGWVHTYLAVVINSHKRERRVD